MKSASDVHLLKFPKLQACFPSWFVSTMKCHGCTFVADGASLPASKIFCLTSSGTGSVVYFRMLLLDNNVLMLFIGVYYDHQIKTKHGENSINIPRTTANTRKILIDDFILTSP